MNILTKTSVVNYQKLLKNIIDISPFEMFLDIGVELVELQPEEPYIHFLIELMQEKYQIDNIEALNMKFKQVQDFYNDVIATYEHDNMFESATDKPLVIENIMMTMMSFQSLEHNHDILLSALMDAVDVVADEYGFLDALDEMNEVDLKEYLEKEVFFMVETLYLNFVSLLDMRNALMSGKVHDANALYATAMLLTVNLSMFNMIRKERFVLEQERAKVKIKRNDPCPCGSGKKYKKCCLNND